MKKIFVPAILFALLLLGGCGQMKKDENKQSITESALEYMEKKYGEEFEYVAPWGNSLSGTHELLVSCASQPNQDILVQIENYKQNDKIYMDNFIAVKYRNATIDFIQDCAVSEFESATVFYEVSESVLSPDLSSDATFNDFLENTQEPFVIMIEIKESDFSSEEQARKVAELIAEQVKQYYFTIVVVDDSVYGTFDRDSLNKHVSSDKFIHCAKITNIDDSIQVKWLGKE